MPRAFDPTPLSAPYNAIVTATSGKPASSIAAATATRTTDPDGAIAPAGEHLYEPCPDLRGTDDHANADGHGWVEPSGLQQGQQKRAHRVEDRGTNRDDGP